MAIYRPYSCGRNCNTYELGASLLKTIPIADIHIGDRQRKAFDESSLFELTKSIASNGLLHPIILNEEGGKLYLVAGGRRLRALQMITDGQGFAPHVTCYRHDGEKVPEGHVPYILVNTFPSESQHIDLREAELAENLHREDLTWQERIAALDELHKLRQAQNPKQSVADTARGLASVPVETPATDSKIANARREVSRARIIAPYLDDPAVAGASSAHQAFNVVAAKVEAEFMAELERRGATAATAHTLIQGDLHIELRELPADTYTCVIADPPYGIGADKFGDVAELSHNYSDDPEGAGDLARDIAYFTPRICKAEAHLWMFCDIGMFIRLRDDIDSMTEWNCWRTPIIWNKGTGYAPRQSSGFKRCYELILFASKGGKPFGAAHKDVIECSPSQHKLHAAEKPFQLYAELLKRSCLPGDKVLDPCCGSGAIFSAAISAGVIATGIEINSEYLDHARIRMHQNE